MDPVTESGSVLETMGSELIGVITPVSICMFLVVLLVSSLFSPFSPHSQVITAANLVYAETPFDSTATKLTGALENAAVFIVLFAAVTFLLLLLYYFNFNRFLVNYMRFSVFCMLLSTGGGIFVSLVRRFLIGVDVVSFGVFMVNFAVVGGVAVFGGGGVPILVTQGYTVVVGVITAALFTQLPEWTTWVLLVALAVYDLVAVLAPGGPLKILLELALSRESRDDFLPVLAYEVRPRVSENVGVEMQNFDRNDGEREGERSALVSSLEGDGGETMTGGMLGLGDFVFYSVLVGRAAMYDLMTVYACYLAIISGLASTLILLSVWRGGTALPALPISIALGIAFYFLTRLLMEPFVVHISTNLLMF